MNWRMTISGCMVVLTACDTAVTSEPPRVFASAATSAGNGVLSTCAPPPSGNVAWWRGDLNALDAAGANHGTLQNGTTFSSTAKVGVAFRLDGVNDAVRVPASASLNVGVGAGFSMSAWIHPDGTSSSGPNGAGPIIEYDNGANLWQYAATGTTGLTFEFRTTAGFLFGVSVASGITPGAWNHVAATYNRANGFVFLYINGALFATQFIGSHVAVTSTPLTLGARPSTSYATKRGSFNGRIDDVQIHNRTLSSGEISGMYMTALQGLCQLVAAFTAPTSIVEGVPATFDLSAATGQPSALEHFDVGTGGGYTGPFIPSLRSTYLDNGTYFPTLALTDGDLSAVLQRLVTVTNATPVVQVSLVTSPPIRAGVPFQVRLGFIDTGTLDGPWGFSLFRNSTLLQSGSVPTQPPVGGGQTVSLTVANPGTVTFRLEVTDKDGATGTASLPVTVIP